MNISEHVSLNMDVRGLGQSATLAINDRCRVLSAQGKEVYKLGLGQSPFPVPTQVVEALQQNAHHKEYLPARGLKELREAVAEFHRRKDGIDASGDQVLIGPGSKELMFILQLVYYGELIVPSPCWVSYVPQARIIGRKVSLIQTCFEDRWQITAESLERNCQKEQDDLRPRILVLNYPGNPDGCTYNETELKDIAEVAKRYEIIVLSDEIYGQLNHKGEHISIARYMPDRCIISSGLSKWCGAGGWRLGTFTFSKKLAWLLESMANVASETYTSVSAPIQYASVRAFHGSTEIERYLWHSRRILSILGNECADKLNAAGIRTHSPMGGFYLFVDFSPLREKLQKRGITDDEELCRKLLDDIGVAILPGSSFGRATNELTARMAYVDFDGALALTASERISLDAQLPADFTKQWCHNVYQAMELMTDWAVQ